MKKTHRELEKENNLLKEENKILYDAIMDFHWMAKRYADRKMTMVSHTVNEHIYKLLKIGIPLSPEKDNTFFAHDGQEDIARQHFCIPQLYLDLEKKVLES